MNKLSGTFMEDLERADLLLITTVAMQLEGDSETVGAMVDTALTSFGKIGSERRDRFTRMVIGIAIPRLALAVGTDSSDELIDSIRKRLDSHE